MDFLEVCKAGLLGIVQGITEWLPISSTGHMILLNEFIKLNVSKEYTDLFLVLIQLASTLAVILFYFNKINPFKNSGGKIKIKKETLNLWSKVFIGCLPLAAAAVLDDFIHRKLYNSLAVSLTLIFYGVVFILIEQKKIKTSVKRLENLSYSQALFVGMFQVLATIPGTSRSGSTIIGALAFGCSRMVATEFSFFLAIPTMTAASVYKTIKYILNFGIDLTLNEIVILLTGCAVSFFVSVISIRLFTNYIKKNSFSCFGCYRIFLGLLILSYFFVLKPALLQTVT